MIPFPFNKNRFSFFCCRPSTCWPVVYKSQEPLESSIMSESDTMFNERDRKCTAVQLMHSTDPSYDNRTITSTLKMQIWIAKNNRDVPRVMKTKFPVTVIVFGVVSCKGHIMPSHILEVGLKVNTKVYLDVLKSVLIPWCNQVAGGTPWVWQQESAPAHKSKETQEAWLQKECYDFVPFTHWPPSPPTWTCWSTLFDHTSRTSPTWPPTCGKGMLLVPDPYRGGDWGWRRLPWIYVSSTT